MQKWCIFSISWLPIYSASVEISTRELNAKWAIRMLDCESKLWPKDLQAWKRLVLNLVLCWISLLDELLFYSMFEPWLEIWDIFMKNLFFSLYCIYLRLPQHIFSSTKECWQGRWHQTSVLKVHKLPVGLYCSYLPVIMRVQVCKKEKNRVKRKYQDMGTITHHEDRHSNMTRGRCIFHPVKLRVWADQERSERTDHCKWFLKSYLKFIAIKVNLLLPFFWQRNGGLFRGGNNSSFNGQHSTEINSNVPWRAKLLTF